ncbi:AAA family ATPase, partial [Mesorhizobium sp.]|uniref:AAA family ATPase n=1 Tax=Mesorhizobium sp. TaxID=1871066 RepID=UPI0025CB8669
MFISTHSHEFFSLMLDWMRKMNDQMYRTYLVERTDANGLVASRLVSCPDSIQKYRSEYVYIFHQIASYAENPQNDHQIIFNLGNLTRRFVEGYVAFKFMEHVNIDSSIDRLITDPVDAERARKFMHFHSHTLSRSAGMRLPDM